MASRSYSPPFFHQMNGHRPTPDLPFKHPWAGLTGAGRTTAMRILHDLEIDFGKVIAK
jgi:hypothetical protein